MRNNPLLGFIIWSLLLLVSSRTNAQDVRTIKENKSKIVRELKTTQKMLLKAQNDASTSLIQLKLLNNRIEKRQVLLTEYNKKISLYNEFISDHRFVVNSLKEDISQTKSAYSEFLNKVGLKSFVMKDHFIPFTFKDFVDLYKKEGETAQYQRVQLEKIHLINSLSSTLSESITLFEKKKREVVYLNNKITHETSILNNELEIENSFYNSLKSKEKELKAIVDQQKNIAYRLQSEVYATNRKDSSFDINTLDYSFEKQKGKLGWPVQGEIIDHFGLHRHPVMKKLKVNNKWITISTSPKEKVKSIYNGVITGVMAIKNGRLSVFVRHGSYITVYSNLKTVYKTKQQQVKIGEPIGEIYTSQGEDHNSILKFQVWKMTDCLDPELWLKTSS
ncbi:peptidoglycan DD-metalloendopeptidase family protein [Halosquirtibacter laminarini]|uniref:Peptidoglycan DD-metalloendopeptidase family protein n=1 Tax=Halosquirtibacter laminarini TaxID=3374600 RepID=A0AC61NEJ0_9BACT|nr:peptidoglycan DD-metalloendopeptidase family protein [Prolixibacteraceae bacterium]